jgi:hypothetical protein
MNNEQWMTARPSSRTLQFSRGQFFANAVEARPSMSVHQSDHEKRRWIAAQGLIFCAAKNSAENPAVTKP